MQKKSGGKTNLDGNGCKSFHKTMGKKVIRFQRPKNDSLKIQAHLVLKPILFKGL
jgi:hypothetical protein